MSGKGTLYCYFIVCNVVSLAQSEVRQRSFWINIKLEFIKSLSRALANKFIWDEFEQRSSRSCRLAVKYMDVLYRQYWSEATTTGRVSFLKTSYA